MQWNSHIFKCDFKHSKTYFFWIAVYMLLFYMEEIDQTVQLESVTSVSTAQDQALKNRNKQCDYGKYKHLFFHDFVQQIVGREERNIGKDERRKWLY